MATEHTEDVTRLIDRLAGNSEADAPQWFEQLYEELRRLAGTLMAAEPCDHTLGATALVNEAYLKILGAEPTWADRRHFLNTVLRAMRQILVDRARRYGRVKHGGRRRRVDLAEIDVGVAASFPIERLEDLDLQVARLERHNPRWGHVVRCRFIAGLTVEQTARHMEISPALVKKDWSFARAWLLAAINDLESER